MATHVKILGWIHVIFGALGIAGALTILVFFGGLAALLGTAGDKAVAVPILGGLGGLLFLFVAAISLPGIIAGIGLLYFQPWGRILGIILSAIHLLNVPLGTALGIYGLWVLLNRETERLFEGPAIMRP